ncbi:hypothetical protein GALMADRAFT_161032 [Galerina marginata CBS 339.88]|uniref:Uncharacterized protein n=1 Tax=Galerina marginata (strain CBS 339.88) TaxID=685588 RepID=A0A067SBT9_GALM3|nr:hypothetical protein GALMADRAFT_161032 [Galerina marginata CBS 339.88]
MSNDDQRRGIRLGAATGRDPQSSQEPGLNQTMRPPTVPTVASSSNDVLPSDQPKVPEPKARKTGQNNSARRPEFPSISRASASGSAIGNTVVEPTNEAPAARVGISTKSTSRKGWGSTSVGSSTRPVATAARSTSISARTDGITQSTPTRVRFVQRKSPPGSPPPQSSRQKSSKTPGRLSIGQPARISSQNSTPAENTTRRHSLHAIAPLAPSTGVLLQTKTYKPLVPIWRQLDDEYAERVYKRDRDGNVVGFAKRISSARGRRAPANDPNVIRLGVNDPNHVGAVISPKLKLRIRGQPVVSDSDSDDDARRYSPQPRLVNSNVVGGQKALKKSAARKIESVDTSSSGSDDDDDKSMRSSSGRSSTQVDELDSDQYDQEPDHAPEDVEMEDADPPEIVLLDSPPRITAPLPNIRPAVEEPPVDRTEPSDELIAAVEALTLSAIRMQKTSCLPFLLRNLRKGFLKRCSRLLVPIYPIDQEIELHVHYESAGGAVYQTEVSDWQCPLCDLLGILPTREMLDCHLRWDHPEVYCEWHEMDDHESDCWKLQLVIPEIEETVELTPLADELDIKPRIEQAQTPGMADFSSPFPSVSLSPPSARRSLVPDSSTPTHAPKMEASGTRIVLHKLEPEAPRPATATPSQRSATASTRRSQSTTASTTTASTSATVRRPRSSASRYPTPPPPDNPLGPAVQPPYLPAKSDYGGPTVHYSCRPGGPCLFDLLGTLPMEPFGLLDWEVLDREDEIYESDDVREEYKVMHALWARWIVLNRNKFIANYLKGVKSFIDDYWKIIHKAAGWDALRYFLFIFLANQFLNGHEVGQVLLHYEDLTGMEFWYN